MPNYGTALAISGYVATAYCQSDQSIHWLNIYQPPEYYLNTLTQPVLTILE